MSFLGKMFKVAIDVVETPVAMLEDLGDMACGQDAENTKEKLKELKKDLTEL